jgi:alpha-pyrone synthase
LSDTACYLHGIKLAMPTTALRAEESVALFAPACRDERVARLLRRIVRLTGIETRYLASLEYQGGAQAGRVALYHPHGEQPRGPGMGARNALFEPASTALLQRALSGFSPRAVARVGTLVTASCTHASSPGLERPVFGHCPTLARDVDRWNLGFMGCSAGLAALRLLRRQTLRRDALVCCCELSSLHFQYSEQIDQLTANLLFADGAAVVLVSPDPSAVRVVDAHCAALPEHADQMVWFADDHGLRLALSQDLPDTLAAHVPGAVDAFLERNGLRRGQVDFWIVHPGGPQVLDAVERSLSLPEDALAGSRSVLRRFGNMSSPTVFFILHELCERRVEGRCLAMAFGPGLTLELVLLDVRRGVSAHD